MGTSFTLLQKEWLVLSLEVDREIQLELSSGFTGRVKARTGTGIDLDINELGKVIKELQGIYQELLIANVCLDCKTINPKEETKCICCSSLKIASLVVPDGAVNAQDSEASPR